MEKEEFYGRLKVEYLKKLLKEKGVKVSGRKAELVERLIFYEKNNNFGYEEVQQDDIIDTPSPVNYKDINSTSPAPTFTENHLNIFSNKYEKTLDKAKRLYTDGFLKYMRYCLQNLSYFVKAACKAEMKKHMQYVVDIHFSMDGEIQGSTCDCPVGRSKEAHCNHVLIVLLALLHFVTEETIILEETCTQVLQTFHRLGKKYAGSPMKAEKFRRRTVAPDVSLDKSNEDDYKIWYKNYFRNLIVSRGINCNMSMKQIVEPANTYAVDWDHSFYTKECDVTRMLRSLHLLDISQDFVDKIELETRSQSSSKVWELQRSIRLTANLFHSCCQKYMNEEGAKSLVNKIINPVSFTSKATEHGKIHEETAVKKLQQKYDNSLEISAFGLFIPVDRPYLGASPDRLLFDKGVIEVKCSYVSRFKKINEITVPYLERDLNNNLSLKISHLYYYQIQGQLYATGRQFCDFVIYTFVDLCVTPIRRDEHFITTMIVKLDYFYLNYLKPAIIEKYLYKNYGVVFFH